MVQLWHSNSIIIIWPTDFILGTIIMITLMLALMLNSDGNKSPRICANVETRAVHRYVNNVIDAHNNGERYKALGALRRYWDGLCEEERRSANRNIVTDLAKLLDGHSDTTIATSIMIDIGNNLKYAKKSIIRARMLAQEREDYNYRLSRPMVPSTGRVASTSLKCLENLIETKTESVELCRYIRSTQRRRSHL